MLGRIFISGVGIKYSVVNEGVGRRINRRVMAKLLSLTELMTVFTPLDRNKVFNKTSRPRNVDLSRGVNGAPCGRRKLDDDEGSRFIVIRDNSGSVRSSRGDGDDGFLNILTCSVRKRMDNSLKIVLPRFDDF